MVEITLRLALPREEKSVQVIRRILKHALTTVEVQPDVVSDLELALTEACTNVLDHADGSTEYEVVVGIDGQRCVIEVMDHGAGYDAGVADEAPMHAEAGRGIRIMQAVVDHVSVARRRDDGTTVRLEKRLSPGRVLFHDR